MFVTKGMPEVRPLAPVSIVAALLLVAPSPAQAGSFPYWGVSFGTPLRTAAHVGVSFGQGVPGQPDEEDDLALPALRGRRRRAGIPSIRSPPPGCRGPGPRVAA